MSETVVVRRASAKWTGTLAGGEGRLSLQSSGALKGAPVSWVSRTGRPTGLTSPEELLAAAHAACFAMALSHTISEMGGEPEELEVEAACSFDQENLEISGVELVVRGSAGNLGSLREAAERAEGLCPVSNALRGNARISLTVHEV
ncbi:peroxiredoxin [Rubrobacter xylanophilus]|uniref:Peroxiredoxin n=1 Tax=Rubrobacter xylanophilus TaxID=49319 RepID=A0A510HFD6_9ACTN|nr:OsmC family peroxiredoxin [Rubrobacter xylanophilus]BBL78648.1 peroxiredoxin [Rubrobacter xylanophilus]